jgi:ankyrin repeat protein
MDSEKVDVKAKEFANGYTALHIAAVMCSLRVLRLLIDSGKFDVNDLDDGGATALHCVAPRIHGADALSRSEVVRLLINSGADITKKNNGGETALDLALKVPGNQEMVQLLEDAAGNKEK